MNNASAENPSAITAAEDQALRDGIADEGARTQGLKRTDFVMPRASNRPTMPALDGVHDRFVRLLAPGLINLMRRNVEVTLDAVNVQPFKTLVSELALPANFNVVALQPIRGHGLVICDANLVFSAVDALFGGAGKLTSSLEGRDFSATELRVIQRLVAVITDAYNAAWKTLYPLELVYQSSEMLPKFITVAPPDNDMLCASFCVAMESITTTFHLCLPDASLAPMREVLQSSGLGTPAAPDQQWLQLLTQQIASAEVTLVANLANADATVEQLLALQPGDFIELDLDPAIEARVEDIPVLACHYGTSNGRYALKVDRLLPHATTARERRVS